VTKLRTALVPGWRAVQQNAKPFIFIQVALFACAAAYYLVPQVAAVALRLADLKVQTGLLGAGFANIVAGLVLPQVARLATKQQTIAWSEVPFQFLFFGLLGMMIDLLYQGLGVLFGQDPSVGNIIKKVLIDMFVATPFASIPFSVLAFVWFHEKYRDSGVSARIKDGTLLPQYFSVLVTCWSFWIPAVTAIYAMPTDAVRFVLYLFAEAGWSLILVQMSANASRTTS